MIGQALFGRDWPAFTTGAPLPDARGLAAELLRTGDTGLLHTVGDPESEEYERRQRRAYRSNAIWSALVQALQWGKAELWFQDDGSNWTPIPSRDLRDAGHPALQILRQDLSAYFADNDPESGRVLVEADRLQEHFPVGNPLHIPARSAPLRPRKRGRAGEGISEEWARPILEALIGAGEVVPQRQDERSLACRLLIQHYQAEHQGWKPIRPESARKRLKKLFDYLGFPQAGDRGRS